MRQLSFVAVVMVAVLGLGGTGDAKAGDAINGGTAYKQLCAQCHGPNMINPGTSSFDLRKFPADQFERFKESVVDGKGDMPAWGDMLVPGELEALWAYVQTGGKS